MRYYTYLQSSHWKKTRKWKLRRKSYRCCICKGKASIVHHLSYKNLNKERPSDLRAMCLRCHKLWHEHFKFPITRTKFTKKKYPIYLRQMREYLKIK